MSDKNLEQHCGPSHDPCLCATELSASEWLMSMGYPLDKEYPANVVSAVMEQYANYKIGPQEDCNRLVAENESLRAQIGLERIKTEEFEEWAKTQPYDDFSRNEKYGYYNNDELHDAWQGWQARARAGSSLIVGVDNAEGRDFTGYHCLTCGPSQQPCEHFPSPPSSPGAAQTCPTCKSSDKGLRGTATFRPNLGDWRENLKQDPRFVCNSSWHGSPGAPQEQK